MKQPSAFLQREHKARKTHKCCECYKAIKPGDTYVVSSGIWEGEPDSFKQCKRCAEIMNICACYASGNDYEPVEFGGLAAWLVEFDDGHDICDDAYIELGLTLDDVEYLVGDL